MHELSPKEKHDRILAELAKLPALGSSLLDGGSLIAEAERGIAALNQPEEAEEVDEAEEVEAAEEVEDAEAAEEAEDAEAAEEIQEVKPPTPVVPQGVRQSPTQLEEPPRHVRESIRRKSRELLGLEAGPDGRPFITWLP